jgi:hypothetical protein
MTSPSDPSSGLAATEAPVIVPQPPPGVPPDALGAQLQTSEPRRRPWGWIAGCAILALVAVGVTIWALSTQSALDDQRDQTDAAQQEAAQATSQVNQITQDVNDALDQAGQSAAVARDKLQGALADLKARLAALADQAKPPPAESTTPNVTVTVTTPPAATTPVGEDAPPDGP